MAQTVNGQKGTPQKQTRPGQRQQERLLRQARRRRRQRLWISAIVTVVVIALAGVVFWQYQSNVAKQNAEKAAAQATASARASATAATIAVQASATAVANAAATATVTTQNCFISPAGTPTDPIYSSTATPSAGPTSSPHISGTPVVLGDGTHRSGNAQRVTTIARIADLGSLWPGSELLWRVHPHSLRPRERARWKEGGGGLD